jgi:hypothetical protein
MRRKFWGIGALLLGAAAAGSAAAQAAAPGQGRQFHVQMSAMVEHDTNLTRESPAQAALANLTPEDTIYAPTLNLNFVMPVGRQSFFLNGAASYLFHQNNTLLNNEQINLTGGAAVAVGPCRTILSGGYARGRSELNDPAARLQVTSPTVSSGGGTVGVGDNSLVSTIQNIQTTKQVSASLSCSRPSGIGIVAQVGEQWASNTQAISAIGSTRTTNASAGLSYQRPLFGSLSLSGTYSKTDNGDQPVGTLAPGGFETKGAELSFSRQLGGRIQASATLGYSSAHTVSPPPVNATAAPAKDFSGLTYSGGISYRATSRLHAKASFQRQLTPTLLSGSSYEVQTGYTVGVDYQIGSRIALSLIGNRQESDSPGAVIIPTAPTLTNSRVNSLSASVTYRMSKRLSWQLSASREERNADNALFDYTNDRVAITLSSNF